MFGLLARLGGALGGAIGRSRIYRGIDAAVGGALPGGVPRRGTRTPAAVANRGGGLNVMTDVVAPGVIGAGVGYGATRLRGRMPSSPPPQSQIVPGPTGQATQTRGNLPANIRGLILPISEFPHGFKGYRPNKSSYYRTNPSTGQVVYIPARTVWVRERRMNPLNPRAGSRAITRLSATKRAIQAFDRVTIRCKRCNKARCTCR